MFLIFFFFLLFCKKIVAELSFKSRNTNLILLFSGIRFLFSSYIQTSANSLQEIGALKEHRKKKKLEHCPGAKIKFWGSNLQQMTLFFLYWEQSFVNFLSQNWQNSLRGVCLIDVFSVFLTSFLRKNDVFQKSLRGSSYIIFFR